MLILFPLGAAEEAREPLGFIPVIGGVWLLDAEPERPGLQGAPLDPDDLGRGFQRIILNRLKGPPGQAVRHATGVWIGPRNRRYFRAEIRGDAIRAFQTDVDFNPDHRPLFSGRFGMNYILRLDGGPAYINIYLPPSACPDPANSGHAKRPRSRRPRY